MTYRIIYERGNLQHWLKWLKETHQYSAQPYQQFARVNREMGMEADARKVLIEQQNDRLERGDLGGRWAKAQHRLIGLVIGYGYQSWRALIGLAIVVFLAAVLGLTAGHLRTQPDRYVAAHAAGTAHPGSPCSTIEQVGLGIDLALPAIKTGINVPCELDTVSLAGQTLTAVAWLLQLSAWALATLVIAGYTGLIRKT